MHKKGIEITEEEAHTQFIKALQHIQAQLAQETGVELSLDQIWETTKLILRDQF